MVLAAVVLNQSAVHWRANLVDDLLFAYHGWCVSEGARPYLDIWDNKPPGVWWLNAAAFRLCGPGLGGELLLGSLALLTSSLAFIGIARTVYHRSLLVLAALVAAVLLTHLRFESGGNRTETYVVTCEILALLGYLRWLRGRGNAWLLLAGLAAGAAPLFKQAGLAVSLAGAVHLAWIQWRAAKSSRKTRGAGRAPDTRLRGWKPWLIAGCGWVIAPLAAASVLTAQGGLGEAAFAVGKFNRAYFEIGDATWLRVDRALHIYEPVLSDLAGVLLIAGFGLLCGVITWLWRRATRPTTAATRHGLGLFIFWFLLAVYLACVSPGRRGHHLMPALPALGLLLLYPLHLLAARRGLRSVLTARPLAVLVVVVWAYVLGTFELASLENAVRAWQTKPHWYAFQRSEPAGYELRAAEILRLTEPSDTIYVWGWCPGTYRWSYRRSASRYATLEKRGQVGQHAQFIVDGAMADIRRSPPQVFVISTGDYEAMMTPPVSDFAGWIQQRYEMVGTTAGMHILTRREDPPGT